MSIVLAVSLVAIFICVALVSQLALSQLLSWTTPERKRLRDLEPDSTGVLRDDTQLVEAPITGLRQLSRAMPKSPKELGRLRRRLAAAGYYDLRAAIYFSAARMAGPVAGAALAFMILGLESLMAIIAAAGLGYF